MMIILLIIKIFQLFKIKFFRKNFGNILYNVKEIIKILNKNILYKKILKDNIYRLE